MFTRGRRIEPELLDEQSPDAGAASLKDLVRINAMLGGKGVLLRELRRLQPKSFLDIGAASGDAAAAVRQEWPHIRTVSLDYRLHHLREAPGERVAADAFRLPFRRGTFDVVYCGLFLHHFEGESIVHLLEQMRMVAQRFVLINDLERHVLPWLFLPVTAPLLRWDKITLHDGPRSVQAGFQPRELEHLALAAGLMNIKVRKHRPSFRISMVASVPDDTLRV
ncbi:MAG TPA: methyltransferase domain-containing protein [Bryobacteraceae bacterium]|nr:methyltransferase domain-containing protein [Bryobacteraceae bacterium]